MKKYILSALLALCAISALAVALLGGAQEEGPLSKEIGWKYDSMRSICYMSVECITTDFSPVQESIYTNRLMYGELPLSFLLTVEAPNIVRDSISAMTCLVECAGVKMEADLKDLQMEHREGKTFGSGVFVQNLSPIAKEVGEPAVMDMMRVFPKGVKISLKYRLADGFESEYRVVKE